MKRYKYILIFTFIFISLFSFKSGVFALEEYTITDFSRSQFETLKNDYVNNNFATYRQEIDDLKQYYEENLKDTYSYYIIYVPYTNSGRTIGLHVMNFTSINITSGINASKRELYLTYNGYSGTFYFKDGTGNVVNISYGVSSSQSSTYVVSYDSLSSIYLDTNIDFSTSVNDYNTKYNFSYVYEDKTCTTNGVFNFYDAMKAYGYYEEPEPPAYENDVITNFYNTFFDKLTYLADVVVETDILFYLFGVVMVVCLFYIFLKLFRL